ncbi:heat shock protein [Colletotrichum melonis]|uniref:Heat shock protein n=1 Tax=Colletotrichum melonis TaxID=1209925 RepID=A0AAI9UEQ8_9PEZI|nr:heat shock protein [Colletotrichum melonis]
MRPLAGCDSFPGNLSSGDGANENVASASQSTASHMSFILADEATMEASLPSHPFSAPRAREQRKQATSATPSDGSTQRRESGTAPPPTSRYTSSLQPHDAVSHRPNCTSNPSSAGIPTPPPPSLSQPMTPILYGVSGPCSAISSSSSRPNSLAGSLSEYQESFVMSAFGTSDAGRPQSIYSGEVAQQFIMPTINVPSRRPFTEAGKGLGRLKLLVAGKSGVGKTALIRTITQSCSHIVHVDPTVPVAMASKGFLPANTMPNSPPISQGTFQITETLASTKPYPSWWKDSAFSSPTPGPIQLEDTILDRNICLVDTPGYQETCRPTDTMGQVSQYVESYLQKSRLDGLEDPDVLKTISGSGGLLVDAVLYMIPSSGLSATDIHYLRQLEALTNIIPLIAHADTLTLEQTAAAKKHIAQQLAEAGLGLFSFDPLTDGVGEQHIYAASSELGSDSEVMDASLLMSSEYVQPFVPSDLSQLVENIFCVNGATWLRHAAAAKLLGWRTRHPGPSNVSGFASKSEGSTDMWLMRPRAGSLTPLALSRAPNYAACNERLCRVQLTNWAADLQRSLANEKRMQELRAWEQAAMLSRETWRDGRSASGGGGADMALTRTRGRGECRQSLRKRRHSTGSGLDWGLVRHQDPLGLLQLNADFRWQGWKTLEMVGGIGILGGLAWLLV